MSTEERHQNKNANTLNVNSLYSIWTETQLSKFGFKCLMNKHDLCTDAKCECLCHSYNQK